MKKKENRLEIDLVPVFGLAVGFKKEDRIEMLLILPFLVIHIRF
tara:strand:+ start:31 stop:162 length:132 start_codon:yes stop_codon:yes gene_type:complete